MSVKKKKKNSRQSINLLRYRTKEANQLDIKMPILTKSNLNFSDTHVLLQDIMKSDSFYTE